MTGCVYFSTNLGIMATFDLFDEDYGHLFLTQESKDYTSVSLEESVEVQTQYSTVKDPKYSDISDFEDEESGKRLR